MAAPPIIFSEALNVSMAMVDESYSRASDAGSVGSSTEATKYPNLVTQRRTFLTAMTFIGDDSFCVF
jgi:hypothetical protein